MAQVMRLSPLVRTEGMCPFMAYQADLEAEVMAVAEGMCPFMAFPILDSYSALLIHTSIVCCVLVLLYAIVC